MKITEDMVRFVLAEHEETRNSDLSLGNRLCQIYKIYLMGTDWVNIANAITRHRRKIQEDGSYPATSESVKRRRKQLCLAYREEYKTTKLEAQMRAYNDLLDGKNE